MGKYILKPQTKDEEYFIRSEYPDKVQHFYQVLCSTLDEIQISDLDVLTDQIYKEAYLDGFEGALYFKDI